MILGQMAIIYPQEGWGDDPYITSYIRINSRYSTYPNEKGKIRKLLEGIPMILRQAR